MSAIRQERTSMGEIAEHPVLYVGNEKHSAKAIELLKQAHVAVEIRQASSSSVYRVAYGTPVLFALSNRYEGLEGVHVFLENARVLGYRSESQTKAD
jgi:hypothetical protein